MCIKSAPDERKGLEIKMPKLLLTVMIYLAEYHVVNLLSELAECWYIRDQKSASFTDANILCERSVDTPPFLS